MDNHSKGKQVNLTGPGSGPSNLLMAIEEISYLLFMDFRSDAVDRLFSKSDIDDFIAIADRLAA